MTLYSSLVAPFLYWSCVCVCVCVCILSHIQLFVTHWIVAHQASLPMEFSRQEYCSGLPFPVPGGLPHPGIHPVSLSLADGFFITSASGNPLEPWSSLCCGLVVHCVEPCLSDVSHSDYFLVSIYPCIRH